LANLPSLRRLDLSGNNIAHVDPGSFLHTPALEHVNLSANSLAVLSPATFRMLLNLFELDVGRNRLSHMVPGLPPGVEYLRMPMNQVTVLPPPASPDLNLPALRFLDLSNNGLKRVPADAFRQMPGLQQLLLSGNALQSLETGRQPLVPVITNPQTWHSTRSVMFKQRAAPCQRAALQLSCQHLKQL
jgi:Leucine-rich repeat (LRR) protein